MSEEEELVGQEFDRLVRAGLMAAGQLVDGFGRISQNRARQETQDSVQASRAETDHTRLILDRVNRAAFWKNADGERVANAATYGATLAGTDPRAAEIYETVRDRVHMHYGLDIDAVRAQFPESEERRKNALMYAIDDFLAAKRADSEADEDKSLATDLTAQAALERTEENPAADVTIERAHGAEDAADLHIADHDRLHAAGEAQATSAAVLSRGSLVAQHGGNLPTTWVEIARRQAAMSYPESADESLTHSQSTRQPRSRGGRATGVAADRTQQLGR